MESTPKNLCLNYQFEGSDFMQNKISKNNLIDTIADDIVSIDKMVLDLIEAINENTYLSEESKNTVKIIIEHKLSKVDRKDLVREVYNELEKQIFKNLSSIKSGDDEQTVLIRLFEGITIEGIYIPEQEKKLNFCNDTVVIKESIKIKPRITQRYREKIIQNAFN
jgi:hypothetical protein